MQSNIATTLGVSRQADLMDVSRLDKTINLIGRQKARVDALIQVAAIQCVGQSIVHRNITPAAHLYEELGKQKSMRRDALIKFFERYGNFYFDKGKLAFRDSHAKFDDEAVALMNKTPWYTCKKEETPTSIYDVEAVVEKFLGKVKKSVNDAGLTVLHEELFDSLNTVYLRYVVAQADETNSQPIMEQGATEQQDLSPAEVSPAKLEALAAHFGKADVKAA